MLDDRITCNSCIRYVKYACDWDKSHPNPTMPRRCHMYLPRASEPDQSDGKARWPEMWKREMQPKG